MREGGVASDMQIVRKIDVSKGDFKFVNLSDMNTT